MIANGQLAATHLVSVGAQQLAPQTAADFLRWQRAATAAGFLLILAPPAGGYRSLATQSDMHRNPGRYGLNAASSVALAPVGESRHGQGRAVDVYGASGDSPFRRWVRRTAPDYGFHLWKEADPNHFEHGNTLTTETATEPASGGSTPLTQNGFLMALDDNHQQDLWNKVDTIYAVIGRIQAGDILFPGATYNAFQGIINEIRGDEKPEPLDSAALAAQLAPLIAGHLADVVQGVTDDDLRRFATAVADEEARRLTS